MARQALAALAPAMRAVGQAAAFMTSIFSGLLSIFMAFFTIKFFVDMIPAIKKINQISEKLSEKLKAVNIGFTRNDLFRRQKSIRFKVDEDTRYFWWIRRKVKSIKC